MRYQYNRMFFEPTPAPGGGNPNPAPTPTPQPAPAPTPTPEPAKGDDALQAKISDLEKKIAALSKPEPTPAPTPQPKGDEVPAWAKTLVEQNEKLATQLASFQSEKTGATRKALFEAELKAVEGLPAYYTAEAIDNLTGRTFADDAAFDAFKKAKIEAAKKVAQELSASQLSVFGAPKTSASGDNGNNVSSAMTEYLKSKNPVQSKN